MNILLINQCDTKSFGTDGFFPLSLGYLASSLKKHGHSVIIHDDALQPLEYENIRNFDVVGISTYTTTIDKAHRVAGYCRKQNVRVILGGPHVSALPEASAQYADAIVVGEGEKSILQALHQNGIIYSNLEQNLNEIPKPIRPNWRKYTGQPVLGNRTPIANINTSRGCPFNCAFCFKGIYGNTIRFRDVDSVIDEWGELISNGAREITINDDAATTDRNRWQSICQQVIKLKLNRIPWTCSNGIRADSVDLNILKLMREAGCYRISIGIESGDNEILEKLNKRETTEQIAGMIKNAKKARMKTMGFFILGFPWDTLDTMKQTIKFSCSIPLDYAQFSVATPYPGTKLYEIISNEEFGVRKLYKNWNSFNIYSQKQIFFDRPGIFTNEDVLGLKKMAYQKFYGRIKQGIGITTKSGFWKSLWRDYVK